MVGRVSASRSVRVCGCAGAQADGVNNHLSPSLPATLQAIWVVGDVRAGYSGMGGVADMDPISVRTTERLEVDRKERGAKCYEGLILADGGGQVDGRSP